MPRAGQRRIKPRTPRPAIPPTPYHEIVISKKDKWTDDWEVFDDLIPVSCTWAVAPSISTATFTYHFGQRANIDPAPAFATVDPLDLFDKYVRIEAFGERSGSVPIATWVGIFAEDQRELHGEKKPAGTTASVPAGTQTITAYGLEHLLRKIPIDDMHFETKTLIADPNRNVLTAPAGVAFNQRDRLTDGLIGNKSANTDDNPVFSSAAVKWRNAEVIDYLLFYLVNPRTAPQFQYLSQMASDELLDEQVNDLAGMSVFDALNVLVDRRRGMGWLIRTDGQANTVDLIIFTVLDTPITIGPTTIPANPVQVTKRIDPEITVDQFVVTENEAPLYSKIKVRGAPVVAMFNVNAINGTLFEDWSATEKTAYRDALKNRTGYASLPFAEQARINDIFRRDDPSVDGVYRRFRLPSNWDFFVGTGSPLQTLDIPVVPEIGPHGDIVGPPKTIPGQFSPPKRLLPWLPMLKGTDYSVFPATVQRDDDTQPEMREPLILVQRHYFQSDGTRKSEYRDVRTLGGRGDKLPATTVRMLDTSMGIELATAIPHAWAYLDFYPGNTDANAATTLVLTARTAVTYKNLFATVAVELDTRPEVVIDSALTLDNETTLVITIPSVQYWYAAAETIIGVATDGEFKRIHADNLVLRDDSAALQTAAALVKSWYAKPRASILMKQRSLEFVAPGSLLLTAATGQRSAQTNTVITRVTWDLTEQTTTTESQFGELDIAFVVGGKRG